MSRHRLTGILLLLLATVVLASCRLDVAVEVVMDEDGTGTLTVDATADSELVAEVPELADALELGDAEQAGWTIDGPTPDDEGGLRLRLTHTFRDAEEATALLASLGGPFAALQLDREFEGEGNEADTSARNILDGTASVEGGFAAFADQQLLDAVGGVPFAGDLGDTTLDESMELELSAELPGDLERATGEQRGRRVTWQLPLDGSATDIELISEQRQDEPAGWARPLATAALVGLVAWLAVSVWFVTFVVRRRRNMAARNRDRNGRENARTGQTPRPH